MGLTEAIDTGRVHKGTQVSLENNTVEPTENTFDYVFEMRYHHIHAPSVLFVGFLWKNHILGHGGASIHLNGGSSGLWATPTLDS